LQQQLYRRTPRCNDFAQLQKAKGRVRTVAARRSPTRRWRSPRPSSHGSVVTPIRSRSTRRHPWAMAGLD